MPETTLELRDPMPYDVACAECGGPVAVVVTIRDWTGNHQGYPTDHLLCTACAAKWRDALDKVVRQAAQPEQHP